MRVYHFLKPQFGLEDIQLRHLKIARIGELNDPFEFGARADNELERLALRRMKEEQSKKTGLLCFSKTWSNPVLWSHYADRHQGICLGFDVPDSLAKSVTYRKTPLRFNRKRYLTDGTFAQEFAELLVSTKFDDWQYEDEVRLYVTLAPGTDTNGLYFYSFSDSLKLCEVVVGAASAVSREDVRVALGDIAGNVVVKKGRMAFKSFQIIEQKKAQLWT